MLPSSHARPVRVTAGADSPRYFELRRRREQARGGATLALTGPFAAGRRVVQPHLSPADSLLRYTSCSQIVIEQEDGCGLCLKGGNETAAVGAPMQVLQCHVTFVLRFCP